MEPIIINRQVVEQIFSILLMFGTMVSTLFASFYLTDKIDKNNPGAKVVKSIFIIWFISDILIVLYFISRYQ